MWPSVRILITYILINCEWFIIKLCGIGIILLTDLLCGITSYYFSVDLRFDCTFKDNFYIKGCNKATNLTQSCKSMRIHVHGEEHVKKLFSTAVIVNEDTHSNLVRGHCFTGEDTNIFHPWSLKLEGFFRKSTNILFYMVTNLFIYTTGSSHIIDDCSRVVCFCQSLIGL